MIVSSTDRALRVLTVQPMTGLLTPLHRFQDLVNRTPWHAIGFSGDGEYVMGGAGHKMAHNVFIWDKGFGTLVKVLEGPRESLIHCDVRMRPESTRIMADGSGTPLGLLLPLRLLREIYIYGRLHYRIIGPRLRKTSRSWKRISSMTSGKTSLISCVLFLFPRHCIPVRLRNRADDPGGRNRAV